MEVRVVVVIVGDYQLMQNGQVMEQRVILVVGDVKHDIIGMEMNVNHVRQMHEVIIQVMHEQYE